MYFYVVGGGCAGVLLAATLGEDAEIKMLLFEASVLYFTYGFYMYFSVVGGGSAGALVAARLSENTDKKVLLLEAGGEENSHPDSQIPFTFGSLLLSHMDWKYRTVPQKNACLSYIEEASKHVFVYMHACKYVCVYLYR